MCIHHPCGPCHLCRPSVKKAGRELNEFLSCYGSPPCHPKVPVQLLTAATPPCVGSYNRVETQPGLDTFAESPRQLYDKGLGPLLDWARAVVPASQRRSVPIFMFATAGEPLPT